MGWLGKDGDGEHYEGLLKSKKVTIAIYCLTILPYF